MFPTFTRLSLYSKCSVSAFVLLQVLSTASFGQYFQPTKDPFTFYSFSSGITPNVSTTGDFNGDGRLDIAIGNYASGSTGETVAIYLNTGSGRFADPVFYPVGLEPLAIEAVDMNGDGRLDLVTANRGYPVNVLLGNGDGSFQPALPYQGNLGSIAGAMAIGDFNRDGKKDVILTTPSAATSAVILFGNGQGGFSSQSSILSEENATLVKVYDFNKDGMEDLLITKFDREAFIALGNGNGTFQSPRFFTTPYDVKSVVIGDVNQDGKPEIITVNSEASNRLTIFSEEASGAFSNSVSIPLNFYPQSVDLADFNNDGRPDLYARVNTSNTSKIAIIMNLGNNTFEPASFYSANDYNMTVMAGDFNQDGNTDIASTQLNTLSIHLGSGKGNIGTAGIFHLAGENPLDIVTADLNEDGVSDLVTADSYYNTISVTLSNQKSSYNSAVTYAFTGRPTALDLQDFNKDGHLDLAVTDVGTVFGFSGSDRVNILLGRGDGSFNAPVKYAVDRVPSRVAAEDINNDGILDLLTVNASGNNVSVLLGKPDGTFETAVNYPVQTNPYQIKVADVNQDGFKDILVSNRGTSSVSVLLGNGAGVFANATHFSVENPVISMEVLDLNQDGNPDIVTTSGSSSNLSTLLGNGNGSFAVGPAIAAGGITYAIARADVNRDGREDLLLTHPGNNTLSLLLSSGNGAFSSPVVYKTGRSPRSLWVDDLNKDGRLDVAVANYTTNDVHLLYNIFEAPTPVELVSFNASWQNPKVRLDWKTASERKAAYFSIERSKDGRAFESIATVKAAGNRGQSYVSYDDRPLAGLSYYRLIQVDEDGSKHTYRSVSVRTSGTDYIYPNPSNGRFVDVEAEAETSVQLLTLQGQSLSIEKEVMKNQTLRVRPTQILQPGLYLLQVGSKTHKWIIQ